MIALFSFPSTELNLLWDQLRQSQILSQQARCNFSTSSFLGFNSTFVKNVFNIFCTELSPP